MFMGSLGHLSRVCAHMNHYDFYSESVLLWCRSHENVADMLGISRLEADGPPAPLYPPGNPPTPPPRPAPPFDAMHDLCALPQVCIMQADMQGLRPVP